MYYLYIGKNFHHEEHNGSRRKERKNNRVFENQSGIGGMVQVLYNAKSLT